ncbi:MAG TPA: efflux RND transporter periplasmic adaptor subunit, partial [Candidatus Omnitrophota bacterium]|nr:efflux RND transporter periplasmic adaptor subunit [Candidatus Omnitrophota bacterium]
KITPKHKKILMVAGGVILLALIFMEVKRIEASRYIKVSGNMECDDIRLSFRVEGKIQKLNFDEGDVVKSGDTVALLETDELTKIRDEAAGALQRTIFEHRLARIDYERAENLYKAGSISTQKRDSAQTKSDGLRAQIKELKSALDLANTRLGFANLQSPINCYILTKSALAGEVVQVGATVFTVADLQNIWVTAYLEEKDLARVKLGQKAFVKTDTYPDKEYKGWVSFIAPEAEFTPKQIQTNEERVKLVYRVKVKTDNSSLELKPGMPADAYIERN